MACTTKFEKTIDLGCVSEIIADIRAGTAKPVVIAEKLLWMTGCGLQFIKPSDGPIFMAKDRSDGDVVNELESSLALATASNTSPTAINPELIALLIQLLLRWLGKL